MNFKKLALAAAIASLPAVGFSVETLEDTDLGGVTGQDGIEVSIAIGSGGIGTDVYLHDTDGLDLGVGYSGYSFDGAVVIDSLSIAAGSGATIGLEIDAGDNGTSASAPILNINVSLPANLTISTGSIHVANSQIDDAARGIEGQSSTIMNNMTVILGATSMNIQLGNEEQTGSMLGTDMIVVSSSVTGGVSLSGFRLSDASNSGDGGIGMTSMTITDAGGANLTIAADINATDAGLVIGLGQLGDAGNGLSIEIVDEYLGSTSAGTIGDVSLVGLNLNNTTITISGK
jgi:hypothetical protein